jgi:hypothetical protein
MESACSTSRRSIHPNERPGFAPSAGAEFWMLANVFSSDAASARWVRSGKVGGAGASGKA